MIPCRFWCKALSAMVVGLVSVFVPAFIAGELKFAIDRWYSVSILSSLGVVVGSWYCWNTEFRFKELMKAFLAGFFVVAGFPIVSIVDMVLRSGSHNLFPIENFVYLVTGLLCGGLALVGYGITTVIKKAIGKET